MLHSCWEIVLKVSLGVLLILSFLQFKVKFGWDPIKYVEEISRKTNIDNSILVQVESIQLQDSMRVNINEPQRLQVIIEPENATDKRIEWICDTTVAKVDATGLVTLIDYVDSTSIYVRTLDGSNLTAEAKIYANEKSDDSDGVNIIQEPNPIASVVQIEAIEIDNKNVVLEIGESANIFYSIIPADATNKSIEWHSSDTKVAIVKNGMVKGIAPGKCQVLASSLDGSKITGTISVRVNTPNRPADDYILRLPYGEWSGGNKRGRPDGKGTLVFNGTILVAKNIYAQKGYILRNAMYKEGRLISGTLFDSDGKEIGVIVSDIKLEPYGGFD